MRLAWGGAACCLVAGDALAAEKKAAKPVVHPTKSIGKDDGYRGIWYYNQKLKNEYKYKYSGGLGTYCAKHIPFAWYAEKTGKTFFCYGGTVKGKHRLLEMVSYYDHKTGMVPKPTILMDKGTADAHDNPVIQLDEKGTVWVFASSHGTSRPSYVFKSDEPYSVESFSVVHVTNFSYPQPWWVEGRGFLFVQTLYRKGGRSLFTSTSADGVHWTEPELLARIQLGHYQISWPHRGKVGRAFNYHPYAFRGNSKERGLNWRTNLYYVESSDFGKTWRTTSGEKVDPPLREVKNQALVHDYEADRLLVYLKDLKYDAKGNPIILYVTSRGFESGPKNDPRTWTTARWTGQAWDIRPAMRSDNNYDTGCLYIDPDGTWQLIAPTQTGPQPYNPGGEMACWASKDQGKTWKMICQITQASPYNHTYARPVVNAHPDFAAFWADGHGRQPSESRLYFCNKTGDSVHRLPYDMKRAFEKPERVR